MVEGQKDGLKTALAGMEPTAAPPVAVAEQLPLLPLGAVEAGKKAAELGAVPRGRGRPPGSGNKASREWAKWIMGQYGSPLEVLAQTWARPVEDLATELGITKAEAHDKQRKAAEAALPYIHQRLPMEIEAGENGLIQLFIGTGVAAAGQVEQGVKWLDGDIVENQSVIDGGKAKSNGCVSNGLPYLADNTAKNGDCSSDSKSDDIGGDDGGDACC